MTEHDPDTQAAYAELRTMLPPSDLLILDATFDPLIEKFEAQGEAGIASLMYLSLKIAAKFT